MSENETISDNNTKNKINNELDSEDSEYSEDSDFDYGSDADEIKTAILEFKNMEKELEKKVSSIRNLIKNHVKDGKTALYWLEKYINLTDFCEVNDLLVDGYIDLSLCNNSDACADALVYLTCELLEPFFDIENKHYSDGHIAIDLKKKKENK